MHGVGLFSSSVSPLYMYASCKHALSWDVVRDMAWQVWSTPWMDGFLANQGLRGLDSEFRIPGFPRDHILLAFARYNLSLTWRFD